MPIHTTTKGESDDRSRVVSESVLASWQLALGQPAPKNHFPQVPVDPDVAAADDPRRAAARRQRAPEPRDVRDDVDGAAGRVADGRVLRQEHDRQGRVPADRRARAALRGDARRPLARARLRRRLLDDGLERGVHARGAGAQAPLAEASPGRRRAGRQAEPRARDQRPDLLGQVLQLLRGRADASSRWTGERFTLGVPEARRALRREHDRRGRDPRLDLRRRLRAGQRAVRRARRPAGAHRPRHPDPRRRRLRSDGRAVHRPAR